MTELDPKNPSRNEEKVYHFASPISAEKLPQTKLDSQPRCHSYNDATSHTPMDSATIGHKRVKNEDNPLTFPSETLSSSGIQSTHILNSSKSEPISTDDDFYENFRAAHEAIDAGVHPILIPEGTSGSYFVRDFFQKMLCFCCFGRACLIPNNGYLSEAAASLVDEKLKLHIVPKTRVVKLASASFFYKKRFWTSYGGIEHWPKEGSYQLFVHGYEPASIVMARWEYDEKLLSDAEEISFRRQFQRMCVLDYVIRNTDRHKDNWLIKHVPGQTIRLAAIDNGLAFPVKHPECASRFRQFPFQWATLKWANENWDETLRKELLALFTPLFIHNLSSELRPLLRHDHLDRSLTSHQLKVLRGQIYNLVQALENDMTPAQMSNLTPINLHRTYRKLPVGDNIRENFTVRDMDYKGRVCC
ncbi:unnamed protein product, partial [Mesorhabditis belari]|uniref:Phosphatidylinositol 4-kinase type 2 n=1 Tax=Mesorhabditis belari TaxID=2138241 RepID=A0AAF3FMY8_9BILA